jgi:hypothetical protein
MGSKEITHFYFILGLLKTKTKYFNTCLLLWLSELVLHTDFHSVCLKDSNFQYKATILLLQGKSFQMIFFFGYPKLKIASLAAQLLLHVPKNK